MTHRHSLLKPPDTALDEDTLFELLKSPRLRVAIRIMDDNVGTTIEAGDLADKVSETRNVKRQTCYVSLIQTHLPRLDKEDVIEYDEATKRIQVTDDVEALAWFAKRGKTAAE